MEFSWHIMKPISKNHKKFIDLVASGETLEKSYLQSVNKKVTATSARQQGSKLAKRYQIEIATEREKLQNAISHAHESEAVNNALKSILSKADRLEWLTKLVNGEIKAKQPFVIGGKIMEYPSEPSHSDRIRALSELNKMDGSYAPVRNEVTVVKEQPLFPDV